MSLMTAMREIDRRLDGFPHGDDRTAHLLVRVAMCDVLEERHDLYNTIEDIFMDDDYDGSYADAVEQALTLRVPNWREMF